MFDNLLMKTEIEAKIQISQFQLEQLKSKLTELNAVKRYDRLEYNIFFDKNLLHKNKNELLRLRECRYPDDRTEFLVTFKRKDPIQDKFLKRQIEIEFNVSDGNTFALMMQQLGYKEKFSFEKKRSSYSFMDNCLVEIDEIPKLGFFCEIEGPNKKVIEKAIASLGFTDAKFISKGYASLICKMLEKKKFNLRF